jgi:hypothetical protein
MSPRADLPAPAPFAALLHAWLGAGVLLLVLQPVRDWHNHYIGSLPYWGLAAPLICLLLLHRHRLAAALSAFLARGRRRRNLSRRAPRARRAARPAPRTARSSPQLRPMMAR